MYALLFAGGVGQRLWPISRKNTPKQFSPIIGDRSSFQLAVERLITIIPPENIFVSTNERYANLLKEQAAAIPSTNFVLEPTRRDLAAAVALAFFTVHDMGLRGSILFQWSDNYIQNTDGLLTAIESARLLIENDPNHVVFLGETPRFPNENLGWVQLGDEEGTSNGMPYYGFRSWHYRPPIEDCVEMYESGNYVWNSGYFVSDIDFVVNQFRRSAPEVTNIVDEIISYRETDQYLQKLQELYPTIPAMHFDTAFLERLVPGQAILLKSDLKWADPGSLYALKEALQTSEDANVTLGKVVDVETHDSLIYNEEDHKVISVMGMRGVVIINTHDSVLVIDKHAVRYIASLLHQLEEDGYADIL